jgi:osmotically-inducible protein OsmY
MDRDKELQRNVIEELEWEPSVDCADIGVSVLDGVVMLSGCVKSYAERLAAEKAVRRVSGVKAIAEELQVRISSEAKTADHEIARRIVDVLMWNALVPAEKIQIKVQNGVVTLTGEVNWHYQARAAERAVAQISGITAISDLIKVANHADAGDVRERIEAAFKRQADLDSKAVRISVDGGKVTLDGRVHALRERQAAERAAWAAPGVSQVIDRVTVS